MSRVIRNSRAIASATTSVTLRHIAIQPSKPLTIPNTPIHLGRAALRNIARPERTKNAFRHNSCRRQHQRIWRKISPDGSRGERVRTASTLLDRPDASASRYGYRAAALRGTHGPQGWRKLVSRRGRGAYPMAISTRVTYTSSCKRVRTSSGEAVSKNNSKASRRFSRASSTVSPRRPESPTTGSDRTPRECSRLQFLSDPATNRDVSASTRNQAGAQRRPLQPAVGRQPHGSDEETV